MALEQQKGISALEDRSRLDKIRDFMAEAAQLQTRAAQAKQEALQTIQPTAAQTAYLGSVFAPGAGTIDAAGNFPAFPGSDVALQDAFSGEPMPSMAENIKAGGIDRYLMAPLQGLGVVGDAAYGIPIAGPGIAAALKTPAALATVVGGIAKASKAKKGITALDDTKKSIKPLSEKEFYKKYDMHHDLKGASANYPKSDSDTLKNKILDEGIKAGWVNNAYPGLKGKPDYYDNKFGTRKGQTTYLVPKANVDKSGTKIIEPYKISQEEVLDFDYDFQPAYEAYLKNIDKLNKVNKNKGITALDDTKKMLKADVDEFAKDEFGFVSPTLEALIQKAPANLKGKQITEWLNANASKGVKPKELEFLGFDDYIAANPSANVREVVAGVSPSKVRVTKEVFGESDGAPLLEFDTQVSMSDPLDGSSPWDVTAADIIDDPEPYEPFVIEAYNKLNPANMVDNLEDAQDGISRGLANIEDVAEMAAEAQYLENPYMMIQPQTQTGPGNYDNMPAFAYGNDELGYQLFVNGEQVTDTNNIPYSQTEAQIQLRNSMQEELGTDPFRIQGEEDFYFDGETGGTKWKSEVDNSLPGGNNYREVVFRWDNAPVAHNATDHFDDDQAIAHALIRDRKLEDGSNSLHIDELQSDVHTAGSKYGYSTLENEAKFKPKFEAREKHIQTEVDKLKPLIQKYVDRYVPPTDLPNLGFSDDVAKSAATKRTKTEVDKFIKGMKDARGRQRAMIFNDFQSYASNELKFNIPDYDMMDNLKLQIDQSTELSENFLKAVPNYPYKDDWYKMGIQQLLVDAVDEGKDAISISGSLPMKQRYSDKYASFYETLYDQKIPSAMKKIANKYGGKFEKGSLDLADTFGERGVIEGIPSYETEEIANATANIIRITPEMKTNILEGGLQAFAKGGAVTFGIEALPMQQLLPEKNRGLGSIQPRQ